MKTFLRPALGAVLVLVVAACADPSGQPWTPPPAASVAPESAAPASVAPASQAPASVAPSAAASQAPASAAPASAAPASVAPSAAASQAPASVAPASVAPSAAPSAAASQAPASTAPSAAASMPASSQEPAGRVIELTLNGSLQITDPSGTQVKDIPVTPGETIIFKLTNTAGYAHNFWIGPDQALMTNQTTGLTGIPDWTDSAPKELTWVVPEDPTTVKFGCTFPGHYMLMNGTFSVAS